MRRQNLRRVKTENAKVFDGYDVDNMERSR